MITKTDEVMKKYKIQVSKMSSMELMREWNRLRRLLNPECTEWKEPELLNPKEVEQKVEIIVPKCKECEYCLQTRRKSGKFEYFCKHPESDKYIPKYMTRWDGSICFGKGGTGEILIKTSPKWCPMGKRR